MVVSPTVTGPVTVPVTASSVTFDPVAANNADSEDTLVLAPPVTDADLSVDIADSPDPVQTGQVLSYAITVANAGPADAVAVQVVDTLPPGSSFLSATPSQGSCAEAAGIVTCPLGSIAAGDGATIAVDVTAPGVVGTVTSTVQVSSGSPDPVAANDSDIENTDVVAAPSADLALLKDDGVTAVTAGGWTTYTLTVTNAGPDVVPAGIAITDPAPAGTTMNESEADCDVAAGTLTCTTSAPIAVGGSVAYAVDVTVPAGFAGATITNTAGITASPLTDPDGSDDTSTDVDDVETRADLSVGISDTPDPLLLGGDVTYTVTVTNAGPSDAANVQVVSGLPAGATFVSADAACSHALGVALCGAGSVVAGGSRSFDIVVHPNVAGTATLSAAASTTTSDPDATNDDDAEDTTVLAPAVTDVDLIVTIADAPDPVPSAQSLSYNLSVQNAGPATAADVVVTEQLPAGVTFVSASAGCVEAAGLVTCTIGSLNSGASVGENVVVTAPAGPAALSATAAVFTTSPDTNAANDSDAEDTAVLAPAAPGSSADLAVTLTDAPDPLDVGDALTYTLGVSNAGPDDATTTVLTFTLPAGVAFTSATPAQGTCSAAAGVVTCNLGTVASGASTSVSVVVSAAADGTLVAGAAVAAAETDPDGSNNTASTTTTVNAVADLSLTKDDGVGTVAPGTSVTYTLALTNAGPSPAGAGVTVIDHLPAGTVGSVTDPSCAVAGSDVTCTTTAPLAVGGSVSWQIQVAVPVGFVGATLDNTATISSSPTADPDPTDDAASDHDAVVQEADLSIFKQDDPDPVLAGGHITYTITVTNNGPGLAEDVVVADAVPAATTVDQVLDGGIESAGVVTWSLGDIAAGQTVVVHLVVLVDINHDGDLTNTATISSTTLDPDPADNSSTAVTTDDAAGTDLQIQKTVDADTVKPGDVDTYTIVVSNDGPADATGVQVEDVLPAGLDFVSAHADRGSYDDESGIWSVGDLPVGASATLELRTRVAGNPAPQIVNSASVVGLDQTDPTPANDVASATVEVLGAIPILDPFEEGEQLAYTGFNFGLALRIVLLLLFMGIAMLATGRRLERGTAPTDRTTG